MFSTSQAQFDAMSLIGEGERTENAKENLNGNIF